MSIRIVCVVCGIESGQPEDKAVEGVCPDQMCQALTTEKVTRLTVSSLFDQAARRAVYVENLTEEDEEDQARIALIRYQRARRRAAYALGVCDDGGPSGEGV